MFDDDDLVELIPNLTLYAHKLSRDNADDLVQATLERALIKRHQFIPGTTLIYWLNTIMRSILLDTVKKGNTAKASQHLVKDAEEYPPNQEDALSLNRAISKMKKMPPAYSCTLTMLAEGYSSREIAKHLGKRPAIIISIAHRAKEELLKKVSPWWLKEVPSPPLVETATIDNMHTSICEQCGGAKRYGPGKYCKSCYNKQYYQVLAGFCHNCGAPKSKERNKICRACFSKGVKYVERSKGE